MARGSWYHLLHQKCLASQGWANFLTQEPQWVLKLDQRAGTKAWMECFCEHCHVNTAAGAGAEGRAREPSALSVLRAGQNSRTGQIRPAGRSLPTAGLHST